MTDYRLDETDRALVKLTQGGLPLTPRPFVELAGQLGISAKEVMTRFSSMLDHGAIRRIAAVPNHYRIGYSANGMSVWDVDNDQVTEAGREIAALNFVSHCYRRPRHLPLWPYNLFAMVHGASRDVVQEQVEIIAQHLGVRARAHDVLYSTRILKKTGLRLHSGA